MRTQPTYESPFHYWISFWPTAPLFGVQWRFERMMPGSSWFRPGQVAADMARASAREAAQATEEAMAQAAHAAEAAVAQASEMVETITHNMEAVLDISDAEVVVDAEVVGDAPARPAGLFDAPPAVADDLRQIKGVGPKLADQLNALGVYTFAQIANFSEADLLWLDEHLATVKGRPMRDDWVGQARALL